MRRKPGVIPAYLFDIKCCGEGSLENQFEYSVCRWLCGKCGGPLFFRRLDEGRHGGPDVRWKPDPRYAPKQRPCFRAKHYGVECVTPRGWRWLYHEGAPHPSQNESMEPDLHELSKLMMARRKINAEGVWDEAQRIDRQRRIETIVSFSGNRTPDNSFP